MNRDKFANEAFKVDPTQGAASAQGGLTNQGSQIANDTSKFALHKDYTGTMLQTATGLLQDPKNPGSVISRLKVSEVDAMKRSGIIDKGMIPKADSAVTAIK